ncbi:MAG TPA: T9SS type A sorting domain-containing protein [Ignavibacteriales bacterium]|nr:T9SS type A sorting domain-containing protein [Ignavibacteriales bacterium]
MKKVTYMFLILILVSAVFSQINAQVLFDENFNYPVGTKLVDTGYVNNTGTGNFQTVATGNLTYTGYPMSNIGGKLVLAGGSGSREDVYHTFEKQSTGAVYASFLISVDTAVTDGDYLLHFTNSSAPTNFRGKLWVKGDAAGGFYFGLSKSSSTAAYTTTKYDYKTTYLVVVKYKYVGTTIAKDDSVSLFINPDISAAEPTTPAITLDELNGSFDSDLMINAIGLRQGGKVYTANLDGIRVAKTWDNLKAAPVIPVTFQANMKVMIKEGTFDVNTNKMLLRGSFQKDAGDTDDWSGAKFELQDADKDSIYTLTADFPIAKAGTGYEYKLVLAPDSWEGSPNRSFTLNATPNIILYPVYYNNDSVVNVSQYSGQKFKITFTADISSIYNQGFDPNKDSLLVQGLDWDGLGKEVIGSRKMKETLVAGVYETTLQVTALADSASYKFRLFPNNLFGDNGWEQINAPNRYIYFKDFGGKDSMALETIAPSFLLLRPAITKNIAVLFQVDVKGAKNAYDGSDIALNDIQFVGLKGADSVLGAWGGNWVVADTTGKSMLALNDKGFFGDKVAGDNIWSREVVYNSGTPGGFRQFKYGIWYTGADQHASGNTKILDNEASGGVNHVFNLTDEASGRIELKALFGNMTTGVKELKDSKVPTVYSLAQNYPNPFNPATTIRYAVPQAGMVTLKIYNMLGQEIATLVNKMQNAGSYEVSFDASRLSSGIYLYNLTSGSFSSTKKMMLVK